LPQINFFAEDISYTLKEKSHIRSWIKETIVTEGKILKELNFIFCSDSYLLSINQQYLNHDTFTDIITFDNSDVEDQLVGDIFISIERVRENSVQITGNERDELHRVIIHGVLHLLGYTDKTKKDKAIMTSKEDLYLHLRTF
jgi:rRNA maturation RNase YbeY